MKNLTKFAAVGVVTMASIAPMSADALNLTFEGPSELSNYPKVNTSKTGNDEYAGPFKMSDEGMAEFVAWCFEVDKNLDFGTGSYTTGGALNDSARGRVQDVFDANYSDDGSFFSDRDKGAAFQLAIWEAIYETDDTKDLSLIDGDHTSTEYTTGGTFTALGTLAEGFLTNANSYTGLQKWVITEYKHDNVEKQDIGTVNAIPLPAAAWLLMFASGGLLAAKRRQARRAA